MFLFSLQQFKIYPRKKIVTIPDYIKTRKESFHLLPSDALRSQIVQRNKTIWTCMLSKVSCFLFSLVFVYLFFSAVVVENYLGRCWCDFFNLKIILYQTVFINQLCCPMDRCGFPTGGLELLPPILVNSCEPFHFTLWTISLFIT